MTMFTKYHVADQTSSNLHDPDAGVGLLVGVIAGAHKRADSTWPKTICRDSSLRKRNSSGVYNRATGRWAFEGRRYWPMVRMSTLWAARSRKTSSSSAVLSPSPAITPLLVGIAGFIYLARCSSRNVRSYRAPERATRYRRGTVSVLWLRMSGLASITMRSGSSNP